MALFQTYSILFHSVIISYFSYTNSFQITNLNLKYEPSKQSQVELSNDLDAILPEVDESADYNTNRKYSADVQEITGSEFSANTNDDFYKNSKTAEYIRKNRNRFLKLKAQWRPSWENSEIQRFLGPLIDCALCGLVVEETRRIFTDGGSIIKVEQFVTKVCIETKIHGLDNDVCTTVVKTFKDEFVGAFLQSTLQPMEICGYILSLDCGVPVNHDLMWNVTLPDTPKPPVVPPKPPKAGSPRLRVLHLTDMHFDPEYLAGSNAHCPELLCCRRRDGPPVGGDTGAGKYGDYRDCDSPKLTLDKLFQHLSTIQHQFDYVMFTGDLPPHNIWNQTKTDQLTSLEVYTQYMLKYLPGKLVLNSLGNHESAPMGNFPPPFVSTNESVNWLYRAAMTSWRNWIPRDTESTIIKAGFYSYTPYPGLKIISLNSNLCYNLNFWLYVNSTDPADMLQWFISELQESEDKGQKVHVLGHVYPGCDCCLRSWSWNYNRIINRYESTITGQFFGHTHDMIYNTFYDVINRTRPVGVGYMPGSVTTYSGLNPGYRIYEVDGNYEGSTWQILDYTNYFANLTQANSLDDLKWQQEYSAKEVYGMSSLYTADWNDLIYRMKTNDTLFHTFCSHTHKSAPNTCKTCTGDCKSKFLCRLKTSRSADPAICADL